MKTVELSPGQIITLNDYPIRDNVILGDYFRKCKHGEKLPFVPVIKKDVLSKYFDDKLSQIFKEFEEINPAAEYFMLDGSHRTTASTLAGCQINVVIYEKDEDISRARKLVTEGQVLKNKTLDHTLEENCAILNKHFKEKPYFMTVAHKTKKMVEDRILPQDIVESKN